MGCLPRTPLVHEDQRLTHFARALQAKINKALCGGGETLEVKWTNFLFVDQNDPGPGVAPVGESDYWTNKFETIQSAVNVAEYGDVIYINPGTYTEDLDLSDIADGVTIMGSGVEATYIVNATDTNTIIIDPDAKIDGLTFRELTITNSSENAAIYIDCEDALDSFSTNGNYLTFHRVLIATLGEEIQARSLDVRYVNYLVLNDTIIFGNGFNFYNTNVFCWDCEVRNDCVFTYDTTDVSQISTGRDESQFKNTRFDSSELALLCQPSVEFYESCKLSDLVGLVAQSADDDANSPHIKCHCKIDSVTMTFTGDDEYESNPLVGDFDDAIIAGNFIFNDDPENLALWHVRARNAVFNTTSTNSIQCSIVNATCEFDMLGAEFEQLSLHKSNNAVDRTLHYIDVVALAEAGAANIIPISPPYANSGAAGVNYTIHPELEEDGGSHYALTFVHANKLADSFDVRCRDAAGSVSSAFRLIMQLQ